MASDVRVENSPKHIRVMFGGETVADTRRALLVWEKPYYPTYFFPAGDVRPEVIGEESGRGDASGALGSAVFHTVRAGGREAGSAAYAYPDSADLGLDDHVAFVWGKMDRWMEEDEEVYVHPRDPHKRVDILASSRHVRIEFDGVIVAESSRPVLLFETGLPVRHYLPRPDVRLDLLVPSDHRTQCPYKGRAEYWDVVLEGSRHENVVWSYPFPTIESSRIAGLMCFYDERANVFLDGEKQFSVPQ